MCRCFFFLPVISPREFFGLPRRTCICSLADFFFRRAFGLKVEEDVPGILGSRVMEVDYHYPSVLSGLNSHPFHIIGDNHQPNSRG